jgi:hypothetical protein
MTLPILACIVRNEVYAALFGIHVVSSGMTSYLIAVERRCSSL